MLLKSVSTLGSPFVHGRSPVTLIAAASYGFRRYSAALSSHGTTTPSPDGSVLGLLSSSPFYFETGYSLCSKRPSRPFPPPFLSNPSTSFSDPLTTHFRSQDRRLSVGGELIRGLTNGDDAVLVAKNFIGVNDGVGAWAMRPSGHAALWSRLILHFWALEVEHLTEETRDPDPLQYLERAYEQTVAATSFPNEWLGTTTSVTGLLHHTTASGSPKPLLYVTNLGDCQILVIRPSEEKIVFKTAEQWHWFDCPRQIGTNSIDNPRNAVMDKIEIEENDIVVAVSDGVIDNIWEQEVLKVVLDSLKKWESGEADKEAREKSIEGGMVYAAQELLNAAKVIAQDPFAESPYMEKAIGEGLAFEGGKMDDISAVVAVCKRTPEG
ncbi:hypothetical protein FQN54_008300 [Arachnomyces sp. PD_36]|nr:hypothetical protein FQN54_008300 [Arachnomyces sp. PD_36]